MSTFQSFKTRYVQMRVDYSTRGNKQPQQQQEQQMSDNKKKTGKKASKTAVTKKKAGKEIGSATLNVTDPRDIAALLPFVTDFSPRAEPETVRATDMARQMGIHVTEFRAEQQEAPQSAAETAPRKKGGSPWGEAAKNRNNQQRLALQSEALELIKSFPGQSLKIQGLVVRTVNAEGKATSPLMGFKKMVQLLKGQSI